MSIYSQAKRSIRDLYWWWKDRRVIERICDNPETYLVYVPKDSDKIGVDVFVRSGISIEDRRLFGVGHLLEHYLSETVARAHQGDFYSNGRINHEMMNLYARLDRDKKRSLVREYLDKIFKVDFSDAEMLEYEKLAIQNELNTDSHHLSRRIERTVETGRFFGECFCIKSFEDSIEPTAKLALSDIAAHYRRIFNGRNVKIFVSAYAPTLKFKNYLKRILPAYALPDGLRSQYPACAYSERKAEIIEDKSITGTYAYLTYPALRSTDKPKDKIVMRIVLDLLTGREETYSVNKRARQAGIYSINSYWVRMEQIGFLALTSYVPKEKVDTMLKIIAHSVKALREEPVNADFLRRELRDLGNIYRREWRSNERVNWIIDETVDHNHHEALPFYLDILKSITSQDIQEMAKKVFDPAAVNIYAYGEKPEQSSAELLANFPQT